MRLFTYDEQYSIICETHNTRNGFKHTANILENGYEVYKTKINYLNRTWEGFTYQSVLKKIIEKFFKDNEKEKLLNWVKQLR